MIEEARLEQWQVARLLAVNNIKRVPRRHRDRVKGSCRVFLRAEHDKKRHRVLKHPALFNEFYPKGSIPDRHNTTRRHARDAPLLDAGHISLDIQAYFDLFQLSYEASMAHVFRVGSELYRSDRLPMGGRPSVAVATSTTKVLASGTLPTVRLSHQIDNVRFSGDRDDVVESAWRFRAKL